MPDVKEPTFFCHPYQVVKNPIEYFQLFDAARDEKAIGEASHAYLTNPPTARVLRALFPEAKFIVILRNPADRAYSQYHFMRRHGFESIHTFEKALAAEEARARSPRFQRNCPQYFYNHLYFRSGLFGEQIERYFSLFDRRQFHFLTLERLSSDPQGELRKIWGFLGVRTDFLPEMEVYNRGERTPRLPWIQYMWTCQASRMLDHFLTAWMRNLGDGLLRHLNMRRTPPMNGETRDALLRRYDSDLEKLRQLTGIRLGSPAATPRETE